MATNNSSKSQAMASISHKFTSHPQTSLSPQFKTKALPSHHQEFYALQVKTMKPSNLCPQQEKSNVLFFPKRAEQNSTLTRTEISMLIHAL
ncbi:uncharacterized protein Pyn_19391 [Prunus yedoensis var. nudiflora]|uniref:Uncharacterized protein n=1 Tax=Prunus yedoensis var. nudiflora TaxID=2094558 RepID=A0A314UBL4_PRUYE|nr:uncharacterized protein Pyn_19391 [Prunus yedoensis var. nudiflora]